MSRHYRMLQKAQRESELFGDLTPDQPYSESVAAPKAILCESVAAPADSIPAPDQVDEVEEPEINEEPQGPPPRPWRESLAEVLSLSAPIDCRRLALYPLTGMATASEAAAALALWIADSGGGPTLIVEANYARPSLARLFHSARVGLSEAALSSEAALRFVQDTHRDDIKILPAGKRPARSQRLAWAQGTADVLSNLESQFNQVVIELPPPGQPEFGCLDVGGADQLVVGVLRPDRSMKGEAGKMQREFLKAKTPLAGVLLAPRFSMGDAIRMERLARQFDRPTESQRAAAAAGR